MGCLQSVGMMLIVVLVIGLIAGQILRPSFQVIPDRFAPNPLVVGIIGVGVTLLILGILVGLLWIVVWLVGKLPAFGVVDLRLALRNLTTHRLRTATTLLALSAGMFALSSISFFGAGTRQLLQISLSRVLGGNVIIFPVLPPAIAQPLVDSKLNSLEGVAYRTRVANYQGEITAVNDIAINKATGPSRQELQQQIREAMNAGDFEKATKLSAQMKASFQYNLSIISVDSTNPNPSAAESLLAGRYLKPEDKGQAVAVLRVNPTFISLGVTVGSTVSVSIDGKSQTLTIIGIIPDASGATSIRSGLMAGDLTVPPDALKGVSTQFQLTVAQIDSEHLNKALIELSALPLVYSFDISYVDNIMGRFIEQMSAIPILVGLLSLGAAAVIMANTVALATLERRRQIGILKAVGLKGRRVLSVMLLENTLVSALGGLIGIGLSALGVVIVSRLSLDISLLIPTDSTPVAIALVIAAVVIAWAATFLSARAVIGERVTNVLRYE
jgi:ABC-type antimicrobial peptide transport system permease subunit